MLRSPKLAIFFLLFSEVSIKLSLYLPTKHRRPLLDGNWVRAGTRLFHLSSDGDVKRSADVNFSWYCHFTSFDPENACSKWCELRVKTIIVEGEFKTATEFNECLSSSINFLTMQRVSLTLKLFLISTTHTVWDTTCSRRRVHSF